MVPAILAGLYLCIGKPFLPGHHGSAFAIIVVWVAAMIGSFLAEVVRVPCRKFQSSHINAQS